MTTPKVIDETVKMGIVEELNRFVVMLNDNPANLLQKVFIVPAKYVSHNEEVEPINKFLRNIITKTKITIFLHKKHHNVKSFKDGKDGTWWVNKYGNCFTECFINGRKLLLILLLKKIKPHCFENLDNKYDYILTTNDVIFSKKCKSDFYYCTWIDDEITMVEVKKKEPIPKVVDEEPIPKFEEKKVSPQKRTQIANEHQDKKRKRQSDFMNEVKEKEELRLKLEQEKKQKKRKPLRVATKP